MSIGSSGGSGVGTAANVFEPPGQPQAAGNWNEILGPLIQASQGGGAGTPAGTYYPTAQSIVSNYNLNNPYATNYLNTAGQLAPEGAGINQTALGNASALSGLVAPAAAAAPQILSTGFDPQQALYNQQSSNTLNTQNAINAMSGVGGTPYGAGVTGQNQQLFNQGWLNNQLGRETTAAQGYGSLANTAGGAANNALGLGTGGMSALSSGIAAPYNVSNTIGNNDLSALANLVNLGNNQYQLPETVLGNLQNYMTLGQTASGLANQIDTNQQNQLNNIGTGLGSLFGGLFGGSGSGLGALGSGLGNLFGIGGGGGGFGGAGSLAGINNLIGSSAGAGLAPADLAFLLGA